MNQIKLNPTLTEDLQGKRYLSASVAPDLLAPYINQLKSLLGEQYQNFWQSKAARDGNEYHLTLINPYELEELSSALDHKPLTNAFSITMLGLGKVTRLNDSAFYIVVESAEVQTFRESIGLAKADLHITLGFNPADIHGVSKDSSTLLVQAKS